MLKTGLEMPPQNTKRLEKVCVSCNQNFIGNTSGQGTIKKSANISVIGEDKFFPEGRYIFQYYYESMAKRSSNVCFRCNRRRLNNVAFFHSKDSQSMFDGLRLPSVLWDKDGQVQARGSASTLKSIGNRRCRWFYSNRLPGNSQGG